MPDVEERPATYEDWLATPEDEWWELADGKLWRWGDPDGMLGEGEVTTPSAHHERVARAIFRVFDAWAIANGGEAFSSGLGVQVGGDRLLVPDVLLVTDDHLDRIGAKHLEAAPDVVVEISSPSTYRHDRIRKRRWYEEAGVPEYWFVDRDSEVVEIYRPGQPGGVPTITPRGGSVASFLDGLVVDVDEILGPPGA